MKIRGKVPVILWVLVGLVELLFVQHLVASAGEWHSYKEVRTRSEDGHTLKFCKNLKGPVTAWLILGKKLEGAFKSRLPVYRIDDGVIRETAFDLSGCREAISELLTSRID